MHQLTYLRRQLVVVGLLLPLFLTACGTDAAITWKGGTLVVGLEPEFEPMESRSPSGELVGFDIDMMRELGKELGVEIRFEPIAWDGIIAALTTGKVDVICSGMTITPERRKTLAFSTPYFTTGLSLLVHRERGAAIASWKDLDKPGIVLAVKRGTTGEQTAIKLMPQAERRVYDSEADCALEVSLGRVDAFVYDQLAILKHARQHEETTRALLEPFNEEQYGVAVRPDDHELLARLDAALGRMIADGRLAAIRERYVSLAPAAPK